MSSEYAFPIDFRLFDDQDNYLLYITDGLDEEERTMLFEGYRTVIGDQDGRFQEAVRKLGRTTYEGA